MPEEEEETLLTRWRESRSVLLADTLQRMASDAWLEKVKDLARLTNSRAATALPRLLKLDDPRLTVFLVDSLLAARWPSSGAQKLWTKLFATLVGLKDRRAIEPLRQATKTPPQFMGLAHTKWMVAHIAETANALEKACAGLPLDDEQADALVSAVKTGLRPEPKGGPFTKPKSKQVSGDALELVEAVWANPDDDATRLVAADGLLERGDPWGEFITLQFRIAQRKATPVEKKRPMGCSTNTEFASEARSRPSAPRARGSSRRASS